MNSWQKNAGWLPGKKKKKGHEMKRLRISQVEDSHLRCKWDQMKGPTSQTQRWLGASDVTL